MRDQTAIQFEAFRPSTLREKHHHPTNCRRIHLLFCAENFRIPDDYTRTGTLAVRSSLPQLTQAPFTARRIAFQMQ